MLSPNNVKLLHQLADGKFHSGQALANLLGCSRSAIWKDMQALRDLPGLTLDAITGRGYRLRPALDLLDKKTILDGLSETQQQRLVSCQIDFITDSTNHQALACPPPQIGKAHAWFAEYQTAGRGRRGRVWQGGFAQNLACSVAYRFDLPMNALAGLSIAVGAGLAQYLAGCSVPDLSLKWPNDLLWQQQKIAGILLEVQGETAGPSTAVIGLGLNLHLDGQTGELIDQPHASLNEAGIQFERNQVASDVLNMLLEVCATYAQSGLAPFLAIWRTFDHYQGQTVTLSNAQQQWQGRYLGIAEEGGLLLEIGQQVQCFYAGEVSLQAGQIA